MNRFLLFILGSVLSGLAFSAQFDRNFVADNGTVFSDVDVGYVYYESGEVHLWFASKANGNYEPLPDASGAVFNKFKSASWFSEFIQVGTSGKYVRPAAFEKVRCFNNTLWLDKSRMLTTLPDPGCATYNLIRSGSN